MRTLRRSDGLTLIELVSTLAIATLIVSSIYLLLGSMIRGRMIVHARVSDQERARQAMAWLADRTRQVNYDSTRACPEGFLRIGNGNGFAQRLSFRAILQEPVRLTYVYYVEGQTLWQETRSQETSALCADESSRTSPDLNRIALTPPIVQPGGAGCTAPTWRFFCYFDEAGCPLGTPGCPPLDPNRVQSVGITMTVQAQSTSGQLELQTFQTATVVRGP